MKDMFKYGIACSLEQIPLSNCTTFRGDIEAICDQCKKIGYEGIELQEKDADKLDWDRIKKVTSDYGITVTAIATGRVILEDKLSLISDDPAVRRAAIDRLKRHIDMSSVLGSMVIVGTMRSKIMDFSKFDYYQGLHDEAVLELSDYAYTKNVDLLLENILTYGSNYMNTSRQVADVVKRINRSNVFTHLDSYTMLMEDNDIYDAYQYSRDTLKYVHFADSARLYLGGGNVDFLTHMKILKEIGYDGWIVTECIPWPSQIECAVRSYDQLKALEVMLSNKLAAKERNYVQLCPSDC